MAKRIGRRPKSDSIISSHTAAAKQIKTPTAIYTNKGVQQNWQERAWQFLDEIGEVNFAATFYGDAFSQTRLFIGAEIDNQVIELNPDSEDGLPEGFSDADVRLAIQTLEALENPNGLPDLQRLAGMSIFQVGEVYLVGRQVDNEEIWETVSTEQLVIENKKYKIKQSPDDKNPIELNLDDEGNDLLVRIWRKHPRWPNVAHSAIRPASVILEELMLLTLEARAITQSRIPAGILAFPDTMEIVRDDTTDDNADGTASAFLDELMKHLTTPISQPGSASAVVPFVIKGDKDDISAIREITFGRELSAEVRQQRAELIERFAASINLPTEIVTGKADVNHWTGWVINEDAIRNYIGPALNVFTKGLETAYLHPRLEAADVADVQRFVIGADLSELVKEPDESENIFKAHDRILISDSATRTRLHISEEEAPDELEKAERVERNKRSKTSDDSSNNQEPPEEGNRTAAASETISLANAERDLRVRLQVAADAAMKRAIEKAGAKLRSLAQRDKEAKALVASADVPNELLAATYPSLFATLNQTPEDLINDAFLQYGDQWDNQVLQAQDLIIALGAAGLTKQEIKEAHDKFADSRKLAKAALITALAGEAKNLMFNPSPKAPDMGEFEPSLTVASGTIRHSLSLSGGGGGDFFDESIGFDGNGNPIGGLYTSPYAYDIYRKSSSVEIGNEYKWVYGDPLSRKTANFEPHQKLNHKTFSSWSDEILRNKNGGWPNTLFYYPGDHRYCGCDFEYAITIRS